MLFMVIERFKDRDPLPIYQRVREQGREWHYTLDPGPLAQVHEHWLGSFAPLWDQSLTRLKRTAERPPPDAAR